MKWAVFHTWAALKDICVVSVSHGWQVGDEHLRKQHRSQAELHYSKAVSLFLSLKDAPCELLRTLLERVAFTEFTMAGGAAK